MAINTAVAITGHTECVCLRDVQVKQVQTNLQISESNTANAHSRGFTCV